MAHDVHPRRLSPPDCELASPLIGLTTYVESIDRGEWVAQRTALTAGQKTILAALGLAEPPRILDISPSAG